MDLKSEFIEFFKENTLEKVVNAINNCLQLTSEIEGSDIAKGVKMYGYGCSISYFKYDKRNKLANKIKEVFDEVHYNECSDLVLNNFSDEIKERLKLEGCSIDALYFQDYLINSILYKGVVEFAKLKGVKNFNYVIIFD